MAQPKYHRCKKCGEFTWQTQHECPPVWEIYNKYRSDADHCDTVRARNAEEAVEKYCDHCFADWEYPESMVIMVREPGKDWAKYNVTPETDVRFAVHGEALAVEKAQ